MSARPSYEFNPAELIAAQKEQRERLRQAMEKFNQQGNSAQAIVMLLEVIQGIQDENTRLAIRLQAAYRAGYARRTDKLTAEQMGQLVLAFGGSQSQSCHAGRAES